VIVELKARAAQGESDSAKFKQQVQSLRQEYRQMTNKLDDKVRHSDLEFHREKMHEIIFSNVFCSWELDPKP